MPPNQKKKASGYSLSPGEVERLRYIDMMRKLGRSLTPPTVVGFPLPYSVDFSVLSDGVLTDLVGSTWAVASGAAVGTPVTLGTSQVTNGNMEIGSPPSNWTLNNGSTLSAAADERTGGAGAQSINVARGSNDYAGYQGRNARAGWNYVTGWAKNVDATSCNVTYTGGVSAVTPAVVTSTSWTALGGTARFLSAALTGNIRLNVTGSAGQNARFDDIAIYQLTNSELMALLPATRADVTVKANWTIAIPYNAGVVVRASSQTNPTNYLVLHYERANAVLLLDMVLNGTITNVSQTSVAYAAGAPIECRVTGTTYQLYYNNALVAADVSLDNAAINANTYHGLFSTGGGSSCDAIFCS